MPTESKETKYREVQRKKGVQFKLLKFSFAQSSALLHQENSARH